MALSPLDALSTLIELKEISKVEVAHEKIKTT